MEAANMDEDLIWGVKEELAFREEQEKELQDRLECCQEMDEDGYY